MRHKSNVGRIILAVVIVVLVISGLIYFGYVFFQAEKVEVSGNGKYTDIYITNLANIPDETHMLMLNTEEIKSNIEEAEPYLEVLNIKKKLPQTVLIEVKERQPKALIAYADKFLLADDEGNILEILDELPENRKYPVVQGFAVGSVSLGRTIGTDDTFKITVMSEILTALENRQITDSIYSIDLSDINNIKMQTPDNLSIKFGQADKIVDKIKWIDRMLPTLKRDGRTSGVLDVSAGTFATYKKDEENEIGGNYTAPPEPAVSDSPETPESGEGEPGVVTEPISLD